VSKTGFAVKFLLVEKIAASNPAENTTQDGLFFE
jgi:hypothetical protein